MDLDNIAQQVIKRLKVEKPKHPIFSASREQFSRWKYNNIYENQWNNSEGRQIIDILFNILLHKPTFDAVVHSLKSDLFRQYLFMIKFEYKDRIVPLIVIFQSVARRLGIYCDLISDRVVPGLGVTYPNEWLLRWNPKCNVTNSNDEECLYICLDDGGAILNKDNWSTIYNSALECLISFDRYPRINLLTLMISLSSHYKKTMYLKRDNYLNYHNRNCNDSNQEIVETDRRWMQRFLYLVDECLSISRTLYMTGNKDVFKFVDELEKCDLREECIKYTPKPKKRKAEMKFAVGIIVTCICTDKTHSEVKCHKMPHVIIGWSVDDDLIRR
ncbi:hypothetical protein DMN91_001809 [Ooceraea biroi]|uniref:Protein SirB1 N-terminal domain-containing protein n=1 Tax=Ooceraea biroi TaxID=2015173 RepID=A0A3L8DZC4_OOCBI|nr:hypothetical protein DMN91_001809 [Ooceraea biroi]